MKTKIVSAAVAAAFFMTPIISFADEQSAVPLVLAKETVPTFEFEDFPWDLPEGRTEDVTLPLGKGVLTMPWMEVEKAGEDSVIINTPELMILEGAGDDNPIVTLRDVEMMVRRLGEAMAISGYAEGFAIDGEDDVRIVMEGFDFTLTSKGYEPTIAAMKAGDDFDSEEVQSAFGLLNFSVDYTVKSVSTNFSDAGRSAVPFDAALTSGPSEGSMIFGDGRLGVSAEGVENTLSVDGPIPAEGKIGLVSYEFSMPVQKLNDRQAIQFGFELSDVTLSDSIWNLADPQGIFPHDFKTLKIDTVFGVILNRSIFDNVKPGGGVEALSPVDLSVSAVEFDGLGLGVSANADVEMNGDIPKSVMAFLSVSGLSEFMANAVKAGFLPQAQAILGEGIALQFAKEEADGSLSFDVTTDNGMVSINGKRVAPLPR